MVDDGVYKIKDGVGYDVYFNGKYIGWARSSEEANKTYRSCEEAEIRKTKRQAQEAEARGKKMADEGEVEREKKDDDNKKDSDNTSEQATGRGGSPINVTNILKPQSRGSFFFWVIVVLIILFILWRLNIWRASFFWAGIIIWIGFIVWGFYLGFTSEKDK